MNLQKLETKMKFYEVFKKTMGLIEKLSNIFLILLEKLLKMICCIFEKSSF